MDLQELRLQIDEIDEGIINLFQKRMQIAGQVAEYKRKNSLPVFDPVREQQKLDVILAGADSDMRDYLSALYTRIFELSRAYQSSILECGDE